MFTIKLSIKLNKPNSANFLALSLDDLLVTHFTLNLNGSSSSARATELPSRPVAPKTTTVLGPSGASLLDPHPILKLHNMTRNNQILLHGADISLTNRTIHIKLQNACLAQPLKSE